MRRLSFCELKQRAGKYDDLHRRCRHVAIEQPFSVGEEDERGDANVSACTLPSSRLFGGL